ncbi:patatin-like phospholipase family protein [Vallitalea okinawensis]|uniref:patatin-like phospholipase family protein n=1 Tax=Vallitalea okinawensis TaxID=2078660 RepID=UPI000CFBA76C|nr:patatin family protein [Vallitalea okinawensis]
MQGEKTALIVEGGAMRGIFAAGVLDSFLENNFDPFDMYIGVSAGALNLSSYLANMHGRNYNIFMNYTANKNCMSISKFLKGGHFLDLDWLWERTIEECRLDLNRIFKDDPEYLIGITDCDTGTIKYVIPDKDNLEGYLKASSAMPIVYRNDLCFNGVRYIDGGLAEPIPVIEAHKRGATKIIVIRSKPPHYKMKPASKVTKWVFRKMPNVKLAIDQRKERYQKAIEFIASPPENVKVYDIYPSSDFAVSRFTKDRKLLEQGYRIGLEEGKRLLESWE